jgi:Flp pilus assembly pilin Flp
MKKEIVTMVLVVLVVIAVVQAVQFNTLKAKVSEKFATPTAAVVAQPTDGDVDTAPEVVPEAVPEVAE